MPASRRSGRAARSYHHGDLRRALLEHSLALVAARGPSEWTLREAATRAGVSSAAAYRHFADKNDLMVVLAIESFELFGIALSAAEEAAEDGDDGLLAMANRYLQFGAREPVRYSLMFGGWLPPDADVRLTEAGAAAFQIVVDRAADARWTPGEARRLAQRLWAWCHGVTSLVIAQVLLPGKTAGDPSVRKLLEAGVRDLLGSSGVPAKARSLTRRPERSTHEAK